MHGTVGHAPEEVGLSGERLERVDLWMRRLVADGKLPGVSVTIARRGRTVWQCVHGLADVERGVPMTPDTVVRIYSMTKPLTSAAVMMLYEEGRFQLDDPVTRYLPALSDLRVLTGGSRGKMETVPAVRDITFRDLLTHTSGLTYGFMEATPVDALYRERGIDMHLSDRPLGELIEEVGRLPLVAQPGDAWNYSIATDVLSHLVELISGRPFEIFLRERILEPLGMTETGFHVPEALLPRFAANYARGENGGLKLIDDPLASRYRAPRPIASGGGGLVSTAHDYMRFCACMLNRGELDGTRLLGRKTVELMTTNHLRGDMADMGQSRFSESPFTGIGFGLGFSVMLDPAKAQILGTPGEYAWGGVASTAFWIDPAEEMAVLLLTQLTPSSTYPIRRELRILTYQAVVD